MSFHEGCLWLAGGRDSQGLLICSTLHALSRFMAL